MEMEPIVKSATELAILKIRDKNWWPALLGKSDIMDEVLSEEFKK